MNTTSFIGLVYNAALLLALAVIFDTAVLRWRTGQTLFRQLPIGLILGGVGLALMLTPWTFAPGVVFDARSVLLGISGLFFGAIPTLIAMGMTAGYRLYLGGEGVWTGVAIIVVSGTLGLAWRRFRRPILAEISGRELYLFGAGLHVGMLGLILTLPWETAQRVLLAITLPVLAIYPLGTALLGTLMSNRLRRERTAEALAESETRYRLLAENVGDVLWILDLDNGRFRYVSPSVERLRGYTAEEAMTQEASAAMTPASAQLIQALIPQRIARFQAGFSGPYLDEVEQPCKNGSTVWTEVTTHYSRNENHRHLEVFGVSRDISARQEAQEALRKSEARYRTIFDNAALGIFESTPEGQVLRVNPAYARMFGYASPQEVLEQIADVAKSIYARPERRAEIVRTVVGKPGTHLFENQYRRKDGTTFVGNLTLQTIHASDGKGQLLFGFVEDITERKQAEEKQAQLMAQLEQQALERERELAALYRIAEATMASGSLEAQLAHVLDTVRGIADSPAGTIHLLKHEEELPSSIPRWELTAAQGLAPEEVRWLEALPPNTPWTVVYRRKGLTLIADMANEFPAAPEGLPMVRGAYLGLPIQVKDNGLGVLSLFRPAGRRFTAKEASLLATLIDQLGLAVESVLLRQRGQEAAVLEERQRLARDLHDSISQLLYSVVLFAGSGRSAAKAGNQADIMHYVNRMDVTALQALKEMRLLIYELRPAAFEAIGLVEALQRRLDLVERHANVDAELIVEGAVYQLSREVQEALYGIAQEALNNSLKHARATRVSIRLQTTSKGLELELTDNGVGFMPEGLSRRGGLGLITMQERAEKLGGELHLTTAPNAGTRITVQVKATDERIDSSPDRR